MAPIASKRQTVKFEIKAPEAESVFLVGDFNGWNEKKHPMRNKEDGTWLKSVMLSPGKYEYKFMVNGQWVEDAASNQTCPNCFGTRNSIIEIREK